MATEDVIVVEGHRPLGFGSTTLFSFTFADQSQYASDVDQLDPNDPSSFLTDDFLVVSIDGLEITLNFGPGTPVDVINGVISSLLQIKNNPSANVSFGGETYSAGDLWNSLQSIQGQWFFSVSNNGSGGSVAFTQTLGSTKFTTIYTNVQNTGGDVSYNNMNEYYAFVAFHEYLHQLVGGMNQESLIQQIDGMLWNAIISP